MTVETTADLSGARAAACGRWPRTQGPTGDTEEDRSLPDALRKINELTVDTRRRLGLGLRPVRASYANPPIGALTVFRCVQTPMRGVLGPTARVLDV